MKKVDDIEPIDRNSFAYFEWLKRDNIRQLRKAGHKSDGLGKEKRVRKRFAKVDESKIRLTDGVGYTDWMEKKGKEIEPLEANPDLWEDDLNHTVD